MGRYIPDWKKFIKFNKKIHYIDEEETSGRFEKGEIAKASIVFLRDIGDVPQMFKDGIIEWCDKEGNPLKTKKKIEVIPDKKTAIKENKKLAVRQTTPHTEGKKDVKKELPKERKYKVYEPVLNGNTPKWLVVKEITKPPNKQESEMILKGEEVDWLEEKTFEIVEPNQWMCLKCHGITISEEQPVYCKSCERNSNFNRFTNKINTKRWKLPIWKDIPREEISMILTYDDLKKVIKKCIVFPEEILYDLFTLWIIASYKNDSFDTICFLMFLGLIESGKTRGLDLLRELGYRTIHTTGVTFPCMCRYTDKYQAGILIDEIDNKIDRRTEDGRKYLDFLKPSYRRGSVYATADKENQDDTREYSNYGFKAFAGERGGGDTALLSRCIVFKMEQTYPEIPELHYIQDELDELQTILLNYRYKFNDPEPLPLEFPLEGRDREIFGCLIQTAQHIGIEYQHIIDFVHERKQEIIEELKDTDEYLILKAIYNIETFETLDDAPEIITYGDIAERCDWDVDTDEGKKKRQRIGYILHKKFHLKTKRMKNGTVLLLHDEKNIKKLENYYRRYRLS